MKSALLSSAFGVDSASFWIKVLTESISGNVKAILLPSDSLHSLVQRVKYTDVNILSLILILRS